MAQSYLRGAALQGLFRVLEVLTQLADIFGASRYAAHSICLSSDRAVINIYILSDVAIALSYFTIGGVLYANRANVARFLRWVFFDPKMLLLFSLFILLCGATHVTMTLTLYFGVYYLDVFFRVLTAFVSAATAIKTGKAFWYEKKLPTLVEALEIPMAEPYSAKDIYPPSHE